MEEEEDNIQISYCTIINSKTKEITVPKNGKIKDIKEAIYKKEGDIFPIEDQELYYEGIELLDEEDISNYQDFEGNDIIVNYKIKIKNDEEKLGKDIRLIIKYEEKEVQKVMKEKNTLNDLREVIEKLLRVPIQDQKLYFNEKKMTDSNKTLKEYGIEDNDIIYLIKKKEKEDEFDDDEKEFEDDDDYDIIKTENFGGTAQINFINTGQEHVIRERKKKVLHLLKKKIYKNIIELKKLYLNNRMFDFGVRKDYHFLFSSLSDEYKTVLSFMEENNYNKLMKEVDSMKGKKNNKEINEYVYNTLLTWFENYFKRLDPQDKNRKDIQEFYEQLKKNK